MRIENFFLYISVVFAVWLTPSIVFAECTNNQGGFFKNPLSNVCSIRDFVTRIIETIVLPIGTTIAVFMLIYTGFLFVVAQGNQTRLEQAKRMLLWTVIGTLVLLGAYAITNILAETAIQIDPGLEGRI